MTTERTKAILEAGVRDFIISGQPITSDKLYKRHNFGIKPAMIRWELHALARDGYFYQEHCSGGRIPSDKAYRFLIDQILRISENRFQKTKRIKEILCLYKERRRKFAEKIAGVLQTMSLCYEIETDTTYQSGLNDLFEKVADFDREDLVVIASDAEFLPERLFKERARWRKGNDWPKVFIGENPLTKSRELSVITARVDIDGNPCLLAAVGPKRMDYERSLNFLKELICCAS